MLEDFHIMHYMVFLAVKKRKWKKVSQIPKHILIILNYCIHKKKTTKYSPPRKVVDLIGFDLCI